MAVRCGNREAHLGEIVHHDSVEWVRECFAETAYWNSPGGQAEMDAQAREEQEAEMEAQMGIFS